MEDSDALAATLAAKQKELGELDAQIKSSNASKEPRQRSAWATGDRGDRDVRDRRAESDRGRGVESRLGPRVSLNRGRRNEREGGARVVASSIDGPTKQRGLEDDETNVDYQASQAAKHDAAKQREADRQAAASASRLARLKRQRQTSGEGAGTDQKRNRRMFGLLNSALKAGGAKTERGKIAEARQKEIAENRIKAREEEVNKRKELFESRRRAQAEVDALAAAQLKAEMQPTWDKHNESLGAFLLTTTKPQIFFMPIKHNSATEKLLDGAKEAAEAMLAKRVGRRTGGAADQPPPHDADDDTSANKASEQTPLTEEQKDGGNVDGGVSSDTVGDGDSGATNDLTSTSDTVVR